jgi:hypothetical protein
MGVYLIGVVCLEAFRFFNLGKSPYTPPYVPYRGVTFTGLGKHRVLMFVGQMSAHRKPQSSGGLSVLRI